MMDPPYNGPAMEARTTPGGGVRRAPRLDPRVAEDPFYYGYRWVRVETPEGKTVSEQVPLTREDLLDPQEGDYVSNHSWHDLITSKLSEILRTLFAFRGRDDVLVHGNLKMLWKDPRIQRVDPDVAVIPNVKDPDRDFPSFNEAKEGTRPVFVLEVTSEATEDTDWDKKPGIYEQAQVEEYFILDQLSSPWKIEARRLSPSTGRYRKLRPEDGRFASEMLEVLFAIGADGESLDLTDMRTGERLRDLQASEGARRAAEEARRAAEEAQRAAEEAQRVAEEARRAAEEENRRLRALLAQKERG